MRRPLLHGSCFLLGFAFVMFTVVTAVPWRECKPVVVTHGGMHVLNCSGTDRIDLPEKLPDEAEVLDFSSNRFTELPFIPDSTTCPEETNCEDIASTEHCRLNISFSRNQIYRFHEHALHNLRCLKTLDLSFNEIKREIFTPSSFQEGVYKLQTLILRGNPIGSLPDNVLVDPFMPDLRHLDISQCQLDEIEDNSVDDLLELRFLNLSYNNLKTLGSRIFKGLNKLQVLDLRNNKLTHLPEKVFADLVNLNLLQLSNNLVHSFHSDAFTRDSNLQNLELVNNRLDGIPYSAVDKLPKLQVLDLSYNPIVQVKRGQTVSSVTTLRLNYLHKLESLQKDALASFPSLVTLVIRNNPSLTSIHPLILADNSSALAYLYLEYNELSTLSEDAVPYKQLKILGLVGNPWTCDDRIAWMIWASSVKPNTAKCEEPAQLKGVYIKSLNPRQLLHYVPLGPISAVVGGMIALPFMLSCVYLIWKRRRNFICTKVTIKGRYVSVYTRDMDGEDEAKVSIDLKLNTNRLKSVSNGTPDETKPFIKMEEYAEDDIVQKDDDDDDDEL